MPAAASTRPINAAESSKYTALTVVSEVSRRNRARLTFHLRDAPVTWRWALRNDVPSARNDTPSTM